MFTDEQITKLKKIFAEEAGHDHELQFGEVLERTRDSEPSYNGLGCQERFLLAQLMFQKHWIPGSYNDIDFDLFRSRLKEVIQRLTVGVC